MNIFSQTHAEGSVDGGSGDYLYGLPVLPDSRNIPHVWYPSCHILWNNHEELCGKGHIFFMNPIPGIDLL